MALFTGKRQQEQHDYAICDDPDCPRFPCRVYRQGWLDGYSAGRASGLAEGYAAGFAAGAASASRG